MADHRFHPSPSVRDVAGAWVLCAVIATLALGLASTTSGGMPPAATVAAKASPCPVRQGSVCQPLTETARNKVGSVAGLRHLTVPTPHPADRPRGENRFHTGANAAPRPITYIASRRWGQGVR